MSKTWRIRLSAVVFVALAAPFGVAGQSAGRAAPESTSSVTGAVAPKVEALSASDEILKKVSAIRGLPVLRPVPSVLKSREDIEALVVKDLRESSKPGEFATATAFLKFLGLVGPDFELERETTALLTEQIAGFYEPKTQFFYLADWIPVDEQRPVIAHELMHALADQHFDLKRLEKWPEGDGDARLAAHALVEGEATALMIEYSLRERGLPSDLAAMPISLTDVLKAGVTEPDPDHPVYANAPEILKQTLQFPYVYGAGFVQSLVRNGAWRRVDACYRSLPTSTEQVMHPEKYLSGEAPVLLSLPDVAPILGSGWRRVDQDVSGEFGYFLLLKAADSEKRAAEAAAGWAGDRYGFYLEGNTGRATFVHRSAWDTPKDASEFFAAYAARLAKRFDGTPGTSPTLREWRSTEGIVRIERHGNEVLVVEGYRGADSARLVKSLWGERHVATR
jgi:hypothetical protein